MRHFYLSKTIKIFLGLALKTSKAITLGDMSQSIRTARRKSVALRNTPAKANDRPHIKSHTWAASDSDAFGYINQLH